MTPLRQKSDLRTHNQGICLDISSSRSFWLLHSFNPLGVMDYILCPAPLEVPARSSIIATSSYGLFERPYLGKLFPALGLAR